MSLFGRDNNVRNYISIISIILLSTLAIIVIINSAHEDDLRIAKETTWKAFLSQEDRARTEYVLERFKNIGNTARKGRGILYIVVIDGKSHVEAIVSISHNKMIVQESPGQEVVKTVTLDREFASTIKSIYTPEDKKYAKLKAQFLSQ